MNEKDITKIFKSVRGEVDAPWHRAALRRSLLSRIGNKSRFAPLQNLVTIVSMNKYYLSLSTVAAVVAIAVVVAVSPLSPHVASAQEQVNRAYTRAIQISPEMRTQLEAQMKSDMLQTLAEAKAAPDLRIMTKEEYEKEGQFTFSDPAGMQFERVRDVQVSAGGEGDNVMFTASATAIPTEAMSGTFSGSVTTAGISSFSAPVKYLSYTDPEGRKTVLGLDENDTPVFKISTLSSSDVKDLEVE